MSGMCVIGVAGLAVMGQNFAINFAEKGFMTAVYNRTSSKVDDCLNKAKNEKVSNLHGFKNLCDFVNALQKPRKIVILIKAGSPVDEFIQLILPYLDKGDLLIDAGNEWYKESERRMKELENKSFRYMAMGLSGGEDGARHGPSLMPGGSKESYALVEEMLKKVAAQSTAGPCVSYIGPRGAGNYVKMVHNGIEYGDMQLISETYHLLKHCGNLSNDAIHDIFKKWNNGKLKSFLIEKTVKIFQTKDTLHGGCLLDKVSDVAGSKGTGAWTVQEAVTRQVPCPTLTAALTSRYVSGYTELRKLTSSAYESTKSLTKQAGVNNLESFINDLEESLYCSKICAYSQGLMLLSITSKEENWNLDLGEISRTWMGGCIIQAEFLKEIREAYKANPQLQLLLLEKSFAEQIKRGVAAWRRVVQIGVANGIYIPAFSSSLAYFDSLITNQLSTNLIQALRDAFGAHGYYRNDDQGGPFHSSWS